MAFGVESWIYDLPVPALVRADAAQLAGCFQLFRMIFYAILCDVHQQVGDFLPDQRTLSGHDAQNFPGSFVRYSIVRSGYRKTPVARWQ
jgi:hypothetical protein